MIRAAGGARWRRVLVGVAAVAALAVGASLAGAQGRGPQEDAGTWQIDGSASFHAGYYDITGDLTASPYEFDGWQPYGLFNVNFEKRFSPVHVWRGQFLGLVNDSQYRSEDEGFVPERIRLSIENGGGMPFRIELGDSYVYFSQRTLQRPLKGIRLEVQSTLGRPDRMQSLQFVSGVYDTNWRDLEFDRDRTQGLSWVLQDPVFGNYSFNFIDTLVNEDFRGELQQRIGSVAAFIPFTIGDERLAIEGEASHLRDRLVGSTRIDARDEGYFAQFTGRSHRPLNYRLRFEQYGDAYSPVGAPIIADRRLVEGQVGWRFTGGGELRARVHRYRDLYESDDPLDTDTYGLRFGGPIAPGSIENLSAVVDYFIQDRALKSGLDDRRTTTVDAQIIKGLGRSWRPRLNVFWRNLDVRAGALEDEEVVDVELRIGRFLNFAGLTGTIEPGIAVRRVRDSLAASDDVNPTLSLNLHRGGHSFVQNLGFLRQDRTEGDDADVDSLSWSGIYRYQQAGHGLRLEFDTLARDPSTGLETDSYRAAATYSYTFDARPRFRSEPSAAPGIVGLGPIDPGQIIIGSKIDEVLADFAAAGFGAPSRLGNVLTFYRPMYDPIQQTQRIVLIENEGRLTRASVMIALDSPHSAQAFESDYGRVQQIFVSLYGRPSVTFEEGEVGADPVDALNADSLIRLTEWERPGGILRFGIPRRLDGQLLLELALAKSFGDVRDTSWSSDDARQ